MTDVEIIEALSVCIEELMTLLRRTREAERAEEIYATVFGRGDNAGTKGAVVRTAAPFNEG